MLTRVLFLALTLAIILATPPASCAQSPAGANPPAEYLANGGGRIWVYLPSNTPPGTKFPCVLVPPAGSRLFHGMALSDGDRDEHWPYVQAGFAVISFDISGPWPAKEDDAALNKAITTFTNARCGINDALEALRVTLAKHPQIDARRVYIAGHSSAGTLALQVAAASDQIKACAAFAPITNVERRLEKAIPPLDKLVPGFAHTVRENSPSNRVDAFRCPILLFHALDDTGIPPETITGFRDALVARRKTVEYMVVPTGGHYDSMIQQGIPKAVAWLKALDQARAAAGNPPPPQ